MGPLSLDLRRRVVAAIREENMSCRAAARQFKVSYASAIRWAQAMRGDFARLQRNRKALMGLTSAGLAHGSDTQVLGPAAAGLRQRMLAIFSRIVNESKDAPKGQLAESLVSLLYALHLQLVLFWLQDPTENQKATSELIEVGEDGLGALRLAIRLPWVSGPLVKIAAVLTPILYGK